MTSTETIETSTKILHELNEDPDNPEDHSRRLLRLVQKRPSNSTSSNHDELELWAWGGDTSAILIGERKICHWDDDDIVSAVAVSDDRTVVAVGFDTGCTSIYKYSESEVTADQPHPFGISKPLPKHHMESPSFVDRIRDLQFYPGSSNILAVAHEGGLCVLDLSNQDSGPEKFLEDDASKQHKESGIRSIAFSKDKNVMASLAMDGRLCLWDVSANAPRQWKLLFREPERCVTKKDPGTLSGADAWDQSCRPTFVENNILALPGETYLQLRKIDGVKVSEHNQISDKGHIDTIVNVISNGPYLVSTGRDKRVVLWSLEKRKDGALNVKLVHQLVELESAPTCVLWEADRLLVACADGKLVTISGSMVPNSNAKISKQSVTRQKVSLKPPSDRRAPVVTTKDGDLSDETENTTHRMMTYYISAAPSDLVDLSTETETAPKSPLDVASPEINLLNESEDDDAPQSSPHLEKQIATNPAGPSEWSSEATPTLLKNSKDLAGEDFSQSSQFESKSPVRSRFVDDEASDADDDDGSVQAHATNINAPSGQADIGIESTNQKNDDDSDTVDDDYDDGFDPTGTMYYGANAPSHQQAVAQLPSPQAAFAPSSTPLDLARRFMCWNHIGSIRRGDLGGRFSVQVDFTDSGFRRPISFTDNSGYILASLGEDGGIFATDVAHDEDNGAGDDFDDDVLGLSDMTKQAVKRSQRKSDLTKATGSTLYFLRFETFGNVREKDWFLTLPSGERALGCATGEGWAAVMTNRRFLRLFSSGGNQSKVFWLQGEPVTMAGRSCFLAVFFHEGEPLRDGTQKIGYMLIDCSKTRIIAKGSATCISSGAKLVWAGFDKDFSLVAMDSAGMVSMLVCTDEGNSWEWAPVLDTLGLNKSTDDSFWPVTVYDGKLVCIPLKGGVKHPDASKRPVTTTLDFKLPLARGSLVKGNALEELSIRASIALGQKKVMHDILCDGQEAEEFENEFAALSAKVDKVTLRLFATLVDTGKLERALDLVDRMYHERSYDIAMDLADNYRTLVDLIEERKEAKFGGQSEEGDDYDVSPEVSAPMIGQPRISPDSAAVRMISKRQLDDDEAYRHVRPKQSFAR